MGSVCTQCHSPDGVAVAEHNSTFVLQSSAYPGFLDENLNTVREVSRHQYDGASVLLMKPFGRMEHGGGAVMTEGGDEYLALQTLLDRFAHPVECADDDPAALLAQVERQDAAGTVRKAAMNLLGRLPSLDELELARNQGDAALDGLLDAMMTEDAFYDRLAELFNDVMLTDRGLEYRGRGLNELSREEFPAADDFLGLAYGDAEREAANKAIAREPLNLIHYVVRNGRPFSEALTADYTVVNPFSAQVYGVQGISFANATDENELHPVQIVTATGTTVPHAGVLSSSAWLNRHPTSPTNRNRHRARRIFKQWLATDILRIAERPIDPTQVATVDNPTRDHPMCVVCHRVIDPVAGGFRGFNDYDYERFDALEAASGWHSDMWPAGFGGATMPSEEYSRALPWLAKQVVNDPRFPVAVVRLVFQGLMGREPLPYPQDVDDAEFPDRFSAWAAQETFLRQVASSFQLANQDLKRVVKEIVKSIYFRAMRPPDDWYVTRPGLVDGLGGGEMLTPEMLSRRIAAATGVHWRVWWDWERHHDLLREDYLILYGGIDSDSVVDRIRVPSPVTVRVADRMANEVACRATAWDFTKPQNERFLFPLVRREDIPESAGNEVPASVLAIKNNIQHLHERFLAEPLELAHVEIDRTYQVFLDTWRELQVVNDTGLTWTCQGRWNPLTGEELPEGQRIDQDETYVIRAWMAVVTYLLTDWRFLFES
jgi:hypothetical protein